VRGYLHVLAREHSGVEDAALAVHVGYERLERAQALHDPGLHLGPFRLGEESRHRVEGEVAPLGLPEAEAARA
jgi:hypothetical protein